MKVTRIAYSRRLNPGKYAALEEQARRLGQVRTQVWHRYGSVGGAALSDRQVRDTWLADGTYRRFGVLANAWKETVRDAMADIAAHRSVAGNAVKRAVARRSVATVERRRMLTALKAGVWAGDPFLARQMRKHCRHGRNRTHNQIVVRADLHNSRPDACGRLWLAVPGLHPRQLIKIPLNATVAPRGTLRLILRNGRVEVHHQIDTADMKTSRRPCGSSAIGVRCHNLGTNKRVRQGAVHRARVRTEIFTAVHRVVDKAGTVVAEDLTKTFAGRKVLGRNMNRRLAGWTKGVTAEALRNVSERRGSVLVHVNAAYTSQVCHRCGSLGKRGGDRLHCTWCGVVWPADVNAAINVLHRHGDPDITLRTPHQRVKQIVQARADRHRTRLPVQDSSRALAAESELSDAQACSGKSE